MNFILNAIQLFKLEWEDTVYKPYVTVLISEEEWNKLDMRQKEFFMYRDNVDSLIIIDLNKVPEVVERIYGIIREHMLTVTVGCNPEIEEVARNISTGIHNYRLSL